jgi:predicted transcriptional regulator
MAENIKVGLSLDPETVKIIDHLAEKTFRSKSAVVDWLVAEAWERMQQVHAATTTIAEAEAQAQS